MSDKAEKNDTILKKILSLGEERLTDLSNQLLENKAFAKALEQAIERGMKTKKNVDRNMQVALGLLNLPSKKDYKALSDKIEAVNGKIVSLSLKVDKLVGLLEGEKKKAAAAPKKPVHKDEGAAEGATA